MINKIEEPRESTLLELKRVISIVGMKINIEESIMFLHISNN